MNQNTIDFLRKLSEDPEFVTREFSTQEGAERLLALAKENGLSAEDLQPSTSLELDDEALDNVSGGSGHYSASPAMAEQIRALANLIIGEKSHHKLLQSIESAQSSSTSLPIPLSFSPPGN